MDGARHQFLAGTAFSRDQDRRVRVLQARDHAQHILDFGGRAHNSVQLGLGIHALAQEFVFFHQANFFRHAAQEEAQFFQRGKGFADVVVGAQLHGLHRGFHRSVAGHDRDLGAGQHLLHLFQEGEARHIGHHHVGKDDVRGLFFEQGQGRLSAVGLHADKPEGLAHGHAELADALLVVNDQEADS